ncbi:MAG: SDR family oxidoreductase [Bacteroidota bacterium]|nr:SDR family oxidoreductase [Bacteroidota bacterium]
MNIIITGASQGIGFEVVRQLSKDSANHIIAIARNKENLEKLVDICLKENPKSNVKTIHFDIGNTRYFESDLKPEIFRSFNNIDILINNAGALVRKPIEQITSEEIDDLMNINFKSPFLLIKMLLPYFNKGSHIVNMSSMGGFQGSAKFKGLSLYSSAKAAIASLSESLALELSNRKIFVNAIAPGAVQTEMLATAFPGFQAPLNPSEFAEFICYFAINGHKFFNGKILPVSLATP